MTQLATLDRLARQMLQERGVDLERYARRHKPQAGQRSFHFESAEPTGRRAWTDDDERAHPRGDDGEWVKKEDAGGSRKAHEPERDEKLTAHVRNLLDAMEERLAQGKQFLARHDGKPLWIASADHLRVAPDGESIEHTNPAGHWVRADLAQLDHWADKAGVQPFTGPEGVLSGKHEEPAAPARDQPAEKLVGGAADGKPDSDFDPAALKKGEQHEQEHTDDPQVAKEIAKDHLAESPKQDYYDKLEQIEPDQENSTPEVEPSTTPHEPPEPDLPEVDDAEPPEEYLAYTPPGELGDRIKQGDAAAADEVMRRLDEQYPEDAQGPKADRARAVRKKLVEDFGEKIGGARKDRAVPTGPRAGGKKPADDRPGWARRYEVSQITKSTRKDEEGKWALYDTKQKSWYGQPRQIGVFDTQEAAQRAIPLAELSRTHSVTSRGTGDAKEYVIYRRVSDRKHPVVRGGFKTSDEAMRYMVEHPEEIIEHEFPRYEQYQYLDHVQRQGGKPRAGDVTPEDFQRAFGFRGGEFGNWQSGRDGQTALNHAYDALHDLADALGWDPRAVTLNGDLAIAFGARGTGGKDAARAHFEPGARVINLTKMRGAGTLAHEFAHALDNYFARQATPPNAKLGKYNFVTEGLPYQHALRPEVADAWKRLTTALMAKEIEQEVDQQQVEKLRNRHWDHVRERLDDLEKRIEQDKQYNKRHKGLTDAQRKEWDAAKAAILSGQPGDRQYVEGRSRYGGYETYGELAKLNQLYKAATGHSFHRADDRNEGKNLFWSIQRSLDADQKIKDSPAGTKEKKKQQTDFLREARKLDETRASSYYTEPTEMLARAFEAYVADKLAALGRRSDYLVGKADNKFYRAFDMAPFPEGEERAAINRAFDDLLGALQSQRWTDPRGEHMKLYSARQVAEFAREFYAAYMAKSEVARYSGPGETAMSTPPDDLGHASATEHDIEFTTGKPVRFPFIHNTERAPRMGSRFGQDIEPHGRYIQYHSNPDPAGLPKNMVSGEVEFQNPLVIAHAEQDIYGQNGWKARLSRAFGGKRGKRLSQAIAAAGYDGIVTIDPKYKVSSEIVDLTMFHRPRGK